MLTENIINYGMFAVITTLIFIFATLASQPVKYILIPLVFVGSYVFLAWYTEYIKKSDTNTTTSVMKLPISNNDEEKCSVCSATKDTVEGSKLLPIMDPLFNLREVAKHLILLEDHLFHKGKRCPDCCVKHILTIDGLLDEAVTLDKENQNTDIIQNTSTPFKSISKELERGIKDGELSNNDVCLKYAQQLRNIRKILTNAIITNKI